MAWPADVLPNQLISASQINAIRDSVKTWGGDVDGGAHLLKNVSRVGAGTTSPVCPLDAHATAGGQSLNLTDGVNSTLIVSHGSSPTPNSIIFNAQGSSSIHLQNNGVAALSLAGGKAGIGVTSPSHQLQLSTDDAAKTTTNTWTVTSDARLKDDVQPFKDGLAKLLSLRPVSYTFNGKGDMPKGEGGISVLAQEAEPIVPYCIGKRKGKIDGEDADILTLNTGALTWVMVNAFKEVNARLVNLERK